LESEGRVNLTFGGNFAPHKLFTITALVDDPIVGQALTLELPPGVERMEGAETQPVALAPEQGRGVVLWKARLHQLGQFPLRIRSNNGTVTTRILNVTTK